MTEKNWYKCPDCGKKLLKITDKSVMYGTPVYCRFCKKELYPTIYAGREISDTELSESGVIPV